MFVVNQARIINSFNLDSRHVDQVRKILDVETWIKSKFTCVKNLTFNTTEFISEDIENVVAQIKERISDVQIVCNV